MGLDKLVRRSARTFNRKLTRIGTYTVHAADGDIELEKTEAEHEIEKLLLNRETRKNMNRTTMEKIWGAVADYFVGAQVFYYPGGGPDVDIVNYGKKLIVHDPSYENDDALNNIKSFEEMDEYRSKPGVSIIPTLIDADDLGKLEQDVKGYSAEVLILKNNSDAVPRSVRKGKKVLETLKNTIFKDAEKIYAIDFTKRYSPVLKKAGFYPHKNGKALQEMIDKIIDGAPSNSSLPCIDSVKSEGNLVYIFKRGNRWICTKLL